MKSDTRAFPETLFVSHYEHSSDESPSLNANVKERDSIDADSPEPTRVAEYKLVRVRKLALKVNEV